MSTMLAIMLLLAGGIIIFSQRPELLANLMKPAAGAAAPAAGGGGGTTKPAAAPAGGTPPPPTVAGGAPAGLTAAAEIATTESMTVPPHFGNVVILVPNEAHEIHVKPAECMTKKNCGFLPLKLTASAGVKIVWLSDDLGHDHTISVAGIGKTSKFTFDAASNALAFPTAGTFKFHSVQWPKQAGEITILPTKVTGTGTAGAIFCPAGEIAAYSAMMKGLGVSVISSAPAEKTHAIIVYTSTGDAAATAAKLTAVTKKTPWT